MEVAWMSWELSGHGASHQPLLAQSHQPLEPLLLSLCLLHEQLAWEKSWHNQQLQLCDHPLEQPRLPQCPQEKLRGVKDKGEPKTSMKAETFQGILK